MGMKPERLAETLTRIETLLAPTLQQAGVELVDLVFHRGHKRMTLRLTIDRAGRTRYRGSVKEPKPDNGVTIADCARVSMVRGHSQPSHRGSGRSAIPRGRRPRS